MSLDTITHSGLGGPPRTFNALVLMGGGARTTYQMGGCGRWPRSCARNPAPTALFHSRSSSALPPERSSLGGPGGTTSIRGPTLGSIAGHAMASVFHDTLLADVEQTQRVTKTLRNLPRELATSLSYRSVDVLAIQPAHSLDALAQSQIIKLPEATRHALGGLGMLKGGGGALASYLLFEPGFVPALIAMGESDAFARKSELLAFFNTDSDEVAKSR